MSGLAGLSFLSAGHSNRPYADLAALLREAGTTAVADVRSIPRSRRHPWFDGPALAASLRGDGIAYAFLGDTLGGRPATSALFKDGVADYRAMARAPGFASGLERLRLGAARHRIALVCSEGDPLACHRCLLVGRALGEAGAAVTHLRHGAAPLDQEAVETTLLAKAGDASEDLFLPRAGRIEAAYAAQAARIAYAKPEARGSGIPSRSA